MFVANSIETQGGMSGPNSQKGPRIQAQNKAIKVANGCQIVGTSGSPVAFYHSKMPDSPNKIVDPKSKWGLTVVHRNIQICPPKQEKGKGALNKENMVAVVKIKKKTTTKNKWVR